MTISLVLKRELSRMSPVFSFLISGYLIVIPEYFGTVL